MLAEAGQDRSGTHRVDRDPTRRVHDGHLPREPDHAVLGCDVGRAAARPVESRDRGHVDDPAPPARQHLAQGALAAEEDAGEIDVDDAPPHGLVRLVDIEIAVEDAGVIDHHLERPERRHRALHGAIELGSSSHVGAERDRARSVLGDELGRLARGRLVEIHRRHRRSASPQHDGRRTADAGAGARDHRRAAQDSAHARNSSTARAAASGVS